MRQRTDLLLLTLIVAAVACGPSKSANVPDSAAMAQQRADSVLKADASQVMSLTAAARADLATLLKEPKSATFDSVRVVQPPEAKGRWPAMAVCGRMSGKGRPAAAFIYQSRTTVFVEDSTNHAPFAELWQKSCGNPQSKTITP
jgi:hypothetical protein